MNSFIAKVFDVFNFKKYCRKYKVGLWECPPFIFTLMGMIIIAAILATYFIGRIYASPEVLALVICIVVAALFILSYIVVNSFERIARASQEKSEFIAIISHQMRTPLSFIRWSLDSLLKKNVGIGNEKKQREILSSINEQNEKSIHLVNDLLEINKLEDNKLVVNFSTFSLTQLIKQLLEKYKKEAGKSSIEINFSSKPPEILITSDPKKIEDIFCRLMDNAINYNRKEGRVFVAVVKKNSMVRVSVRDEGIGIPQKNQSRIFEKFYRVDISRKIKTGGLGVSLYIVKRLVNFLGGHVGFSSIEGRGSTFWFELPLKNK